MKKCFAILIFLGCLGINISAQSFVPDKDNKTDIRRNVDLYLEEVNLSRKMVIFCEEKDRVFARDISNGEIVKSLESDSNWVEVKKHKIFPFYGHKKGAIRSWKYKNSPSLQITQVRDKSGGEFFEIDIDKWRGPWKHFFREVVPHFFGKRSKIFFFVPKQTNQEKIGRQLAKWQVQKTAEK